MKTLFLGILVGVVLPFIAGWLFIINGGMPVKVKDAPLPLEEYFAGKAIHAAMKSVVNSPPPIASDEDSLKAGAKIYSQHCAVCHGLPAARPTAIAKGMFPSPPQFFQEGDGVGDDPPARTYWKVKNGFRLTGMPGFADSLSDVEMWQVTLMLSKGDKLPETVKSFLQTK